MGQGVRCARASFARFVFLGSTADLRPVRALLIGHLHVSIRGDANGIDLTLTYISISFTEFMRAGKSHERENSTCVQAYL